VKSSISVGRIAGVPVQVDWTWLIVFGLFAWILATGVFPRSNPGMGDGTYAVMAVVAVLLFFVSILLHELGHAVQARRDGMRIEGITLWLLGGVARFRDMFPSALAELRIALAGPAVTAVIAGALVLLSWGLPLPESVDAVAAWLGWINLTLLAFNLLPALPLDGGRVLRSLLWHVRGDFASATRVAGRAGQGFAYLMIGLGIFVLIWRQDTNGIWLAVVGWFLLRAAQAELALAQVPMDVIRTAMDPPPRSMAGMRVRDVMVREPVTTTPELTLGRFVDQAWSSRFASYPVLADGRPVGIVSLPRVLAVPRRHWDDYKVADLMIALGSAPVVGEDDDLEAAIARLLVAEPGRALVLDGDRLVGLLSISDVGWALEGAQRA
jgi:Zn-dependent protease/CBS domain-containing protein